VILVFNASPVIVLAKAGLLEQFCLLGEPSWVPQTVVDEVLRVSDPADPARVWFEATSRSMCVIATPPMPPFLGGWDLGAGESAVISLVVAQPGSVAVLDDLAARRCALAHGIQMTGTLGLVLLAKKRGLIAEVGSALQAIVAAGLYISPKHLADVRAKAGE
jgi:predicted nucleic acid-binding protein